MALACGPGHRPAPMGVCRHLRPHFEPYRLFSLVAADDLCAFAQPDHAVGIRLCGLAAIQASRGNTPMRPVPSPRPVGLNTDDDVVIDAIVTSDLRRVSFEPGSGSCSRRNPGALPGSTGSLFLRRF